MDSVQGLKELKIFEADAAQHVKINQSAEEFRVITMKVLVMQLASTTIGLIRNCCYISFRIQTYLMFTAKGPTIINQ